MESSEKDFKIPEWDFRIWFTPKKSENLDLVGLCDADWASNSDDRRPKSEYCVYLDSKLVACHSKNSMLFLDQVQKFS